MLFNQLDLFTLEVTARFHELLQLHLLKSQLVSQSVPFLQKLGLEVAASNLFLRLSQVFSKEGLLLVKLCNFLLPVLTAGVHMDEVVHDIVPFFMCLADLHTG